jgi:hypothetical protein
VRSHDVDRPNLIGVKTERKLGHEEHARGEP